MYMYMSNFVHTMYRLITEYVHVHVQCTYLQLAGVVHEDSLVDFGQVTQVESVVRLGRCREQTAADSTKHYVVCFNQLLDVFRQTRVDR